MSDTHEKIWFIIVHEEEEGPYSFMDLKSDWRIHEFTLVWRDGFVRWMPIKDVPELKALFPEKEESEGRLGSSEQELALEVDREPPFWPIFLLLLALMFLYVLFSLFYTP